LNPEPAVIFAEEDKRHRHRLKPTPDALPDGMTMVTVFTGL
jgi:hypothetical protein